VLGRAVRLCCNSLLAVAQQVTAATRLLDSGLKKATLTFLVFGWLLLDLVTILVGSGDAS
jgi:hypothetical protein